MNLLCSIGIHRWRMERVLEQTMPSGIVIYLNEDVCQRCEKVRDVVNMASVYNLMANNPGRIVVHPDRLPTDTTGAKG